MQRTFLVVALAGALVVGCGPPRGGQGLTYVPPTRPPPATGAVFVPVAPDALLERLAERLPQAGFDLRRVERDRGLLVALYAGDPEPYVDCGWILPVDAGRANGPGETDAARERASFARAFEGAPALFARDLRLDSRLVVTVTPSAGGSLVETNAAYVLTKSVDVLGRGGLLAEDRETISFSTGGTGTFRAGTICQPSGGLERLVLEDLTPTVVAAEPAPEPAAGPDPALAAAVEAVIAAFACPDIEVTFGPDNAVLLSGYVADPFSQAELPRQLQRIRGIGPVEARLAVHGPEFCRAIEIVAPYAADGRLEPLEVRAAAPDGALRAGERLVLDLTVPAPDVYLIIDRIGPDGRVAHVAAGRRASELGAGPGATSFRLDTGRDARPPFGREMIVVVATEQPLLEGRRPLGQSTDAYLTELGDRIAELRAQGEPVGATYTVVTTRRAEGV